MPDTSTLDFRSFNYAVLTQQRPDSFLKEFQDRASAAKFKRKQLTVEERWEGFSMIGFRPHGVYVPKDHEARIELFDEIRLCGDIDDEDLRRQRYAEIQRETETWFNAGIEGDWGGQQGPARSSAQYRLIAAGRRYGKTYLAAHEGIAFALMRPGSLIWCIAPTMRLVKRVFDMIVQIIEARKIPYRFMRNTDNEKYIKLENGTEFEGIPIGADVGAAAGAAVDFAIVDEASQLDAIHWDRGVQPTLADKNGQALILSSLNGEGNWFHSQLVQAQQDWSEYLRDSGGTQNPKTSPAWQSWTGATWDNFAAFPQGRSSAFIVAAEKSNQPLDFLEQYGAIASGARDRVYPEFKETVHVGHYPFQEDWPVTMAADPSGGANPYALMAIQDFGNEIHIIDELYELRMTPEEYAPILARRPWWANVEDMIIDSAAGEIEVGRWEKLGISCYMVEKPLIQERLPLVRNLLRDPGLFDPVKYEKIAIACREAGMDPDLYETLEPRDQRPILIRIEELLAEQNLSSIDIANLQHCSWVKVHSTCVNTIYEFNHYGWAPRPHGADNFRERPKDRDNHLMDGFGYWVWEKKRFDIYDRADTPVNYLQPAQGSWTAALPFDDNSYVSPALGGWLASMRAHYSEGDNKFVNFLVAI